MFLNIDGIKNVPRLPVQALLKEDSFLTQRRTIRIVGLLIKCVQLAKGGSLMVNNPFIEQRITALEISMLDLKEIVSEVSRQIAINSLEIKESQIHASQNVAQLSLEMRDFKNEMRLFKHEMTGFKDEMLDFKDEMKVFKDEMKVFKSEMLDFKDEMKVFKSEMLDFKDEMRDFKNESILFREEMRQEKRQHNLEMGKIANRQGRMTEDLVAPSLCRIMKQALNIDQGEGCIANVRVVRPLRGDRKRTREFDVIVECEDYVLVNETKNSMTSRDVEHWLKTVLKVRDYFPEFSGRKIIGSVASLYLAPSVVNFATKNGVLALAVGEELLDILNPHGFEPKSW